ncbi:MAG: hypothetical protein WCL16_13745, partial [bacterium]
MHIRNDGTTTVSDVELALLQGPHEEPWDFYVTMTCPAGDYKTKIKFDPALPANKKEDGTTSGYAHFSGGIDQGYWQITANTLAGFFNQGVVSSRSTAEIPAKAYAPQEVSTTAFSPTLPALTPGQVLHLGSRVTGDYEDVTVVTYDAARQQFTAVFKYFHTVGTAVISAPNRLRKGDSLLIKIGTGKERLNHEMLLDATNLVIPRRGGVQQDTPVIKLASCPPGSDRLIYEQWVLDPGGSTAGVASDLVHLGGDLFGPGTSTMEPRVVHATDNRYGTVRFSTLLTGDAVVPVVDTTKRVVATGVTSPAAGSTLLIGTGVNDTAVNVSRLGATVKVLGDATMAGATTLVGSTVVAGPSAFQTAPTFTTDIAFPKSVAVKNTLNLSGNVYLDSSSTQFLVKTAGQLTVGAQGAGAALHLQAGGVDHWSVDGSGELRSVTGRVISGVADPVNDHDVVNKKYGDDRWGNQTTAYALKSYVDGQDTTYFGKATAYTDSAIAGYPAAWQAYTNKEITSLTTASQKYTNDAVATEKRDHTDPAFAAVNSTITAIPSTRHTWSVTQTFTGDADFQNTTTVKT